MRKATTDKQSHSAKGARDQEALSLRKAKPNRASAVDAVNKPPELPPQVVESLRSASQAGIWLIAVFRVEDNRMQLERTARNFPIADLDLACRLFVESLQELKQ